MKLMIKSIIALMLTVILMAAVPALAGQNNVLLFGGKLDQWGGDYTQQVAAVGDTLYITRSSGLYAYHLGDEAPKQLMDFTKTDLSGSALPEPGKAMISIGSLLGSENSLYSLDLYRGALWYFDPKAAAFVLEVSFQPLSADEVQQYLFSGFCMADEAVYYIAADPRTDARNLMKIDLTSGKIELVRSGIYLVTPYAKGILLVGLDTMSSSGTLALMDATTGAMEEKLQLTGSFRGLHYDQATDTVYLYRKGEIYQSHAFSQPVTAARMPMVSPVSGGALLAGGHLAFPYEDGVRIYTADPKALNDLPLKIAGQTFDLDMEAFSKENPNVTFSFLDYYPESTKDLVMHMMGGESAADIYAIDLRGYSLDSLYEKGYFAGLQDSETIKSTVSAMYPFIKDALMRDGQSIAMPFALTNNVFAYNPRAFEAVGLTEQDVPKTYGELLDFIQRWGEEYAEKFPSMSLFWQGAEPKFYKRLFSQSVIEDHMYACLRSGEPIVCNTPHMKALLSKLMATDFSVISALAPESTANEYATPDDWPKNLFNIWNGSTTEATFIDFFSYMPLSLNDDEMPVVLVDIQALLINPYSENYDNALKFIEFMAGSLPVVTRADLMPGENEPVRDTSLTSTLTWLEKEISATEKALKEAKEEDKRNVQERLDSLRQDYDFQRRFEWRISEKSIVAYRALDPYFMLQKPNPIFGLDNNDDLEDLFYNRFQDGQVSVDQFLSELDQKLRMIELED